MPESPNSKKMSFGQMPARQILKKLGSGNARKGKFEKVGVWVNARIEILEILPFGQMPASQNLKK